MKLKSWMILLAAITLMLCSACTTVRADTDRDSIVGTWSDSYGLTKYQFQTNGSMKIQALSIGTFKGTYQVAGDEITIEYRILIKDVKNTYKMKLEGNKLYLNGNEYTRKK